MCSLLVGVHVCVYCLISENMNFYGIICPIYIKPKRLASDFTILSKDCL